MGDLHVWLGGSSKGERLIHALVESRYIETRGIKMADSGRQKEGETHLTKMKYQEGLERAAGLLLDFTFLVPQV